MNIRTNIKLNSTKPAVLPIRKSDKVIIRSIGLQKDQVLSKHKTPFETTLIVLRGKIRFSTAEREKELKELDVFEVPCDVFHEVVGLEESIFVLIHEKD